MSFRDSLNHETPWWSAKATQGGGSSGQRIGRWGPFLSVRGPLPWPSSPFVGVRGSHLLKPLWFCAEGFSGILWHPVPVSWKVFCLAFANTTAFENTVTGFQILGCDCSPILLKTSSSTRKGARELRFVKWALKAARRLLRGSWKNYTCCFGGVSLWLLLFYLPKWVVTEFGYI